MTAPTPEDLQRYRRNLQAEVDSAALYRAMAAVEPKAELATIYRRLAEAEEAHVAFWRHRLEQAGARLPRLHPGWRAKVLIWAARRLGAASVLPTVAAQEAQDQGNYDDQKEAQDTRLPDEERSHARLLTRMAVGSHEGRWDGSAYARIEGRHGAGGGNALRAAVLGANDGLVSTLSLVMGVAGAQFSSGAVAAAGLAGMLAGACSMAMGEWVSVQSSREMYAHQIAAEAEELAQVPEEEQTELSLIYQAKGFSAEEANTIAARVIRNPDTALDTLTREELGINPDDLGGSARLAAVTSFLVFVVGALLPVLPLLVLHGSGAVLGSALASALGLFLIGAGISVFTGRGLWFSGLRQLVIGAAAAAVTYGAGWAVERWLGA
ncbi:VIT1/CCC1 transporter family protein [Azospira inquinata]|nr:VIT1/CCC1 transporter family protein [Azospira inquinata]